MGIKSLYETRDPVISLAATLLTVAPFLPGDLLPLQAIAGVATVATVALATYYLRKRRTAAPIPTPQTKL